MGRAVGVLLREPGDVVARLDAEALARERGVLPVPLEAPLQPQREPQEEGVGRPEVDGRREPVGWDKAGSDLTATAKRRDGSDVGWVDAGIAPPPNLATKLVARDA